HQDVDDLPNLLVSTADRIELAFLSALRQVRREALERLLLAHLCGRHRVAGLAGPCERRPVARAEPVLGRAAHDLREIVGERVWLDLLELARDRHERVAQRRRLHHAADEMARADPRLAVHQRGVHPAALDSVLDLRREIRDRGCAARQPVERVGHVLREPRRIDLEVSDDAMEVGILRLENLLDPVNELHVRIPAELAEDRGTLNRLVGEAIELAEQRRTADLAHAACAPYAMNPSGSRCRSSAGVVLCRRPSHVVQPRRVPPPRVSRGTSSRFSSRHTSQSSSKHKYIRTQSTSFLSGAPPGRKLSYRSSVSGPRWMRTLCWRPHTRRPLPAPPARETGA